MYINQNKQKYLQPENIPINHNNLHGHTLEATYHRTPIARKNFMPIYSHRNRDSKNSFGSLKSLKKSPFLIVHSKSSSTGPKYEKKYEQKKFFKVLPTSPIFQTDRKNESRKITNENKIKFKKYIRENNIFDTENNNRTSEIQSPKIFGKFKIKGNIFDDESSENTDREIIYSRGSYIENSPNIFLDKNDKNKSPKFIEEKGNIFNTIFTGKSSGNIIINKNINTINPVYNTINKNDENYKQNNIFDTCTNNSKNNFSDYNIQNDHQINNSPYIENRNFVKEEIYDSFNSMSQEYSDKEISKFQEVYDPNINSKGILVKNLQVTLPLVKDDFFKKHSRNITKIKKLSEILLFHNKNKLNNELVNNCLTPRNKLTIRSISKFNLMRRSRSSLLFSNAIKSPEKKLKYTSLAMIMNKNLKTEDKIISRKMRIEKGGVVDFAQNEITQKQKYKIKSFNKSNKIIRYSKNPKYREKAAVIIQMWWSSIKELYNRKLKSIIFIQSVIRGKIVRKYMTILLYLDSLYINFCDIIEELIIKKKKQYFLYQLNNFKKNYNFYIYKKYDNLRNLIISFSQKSKICNLRYYFNKWKKIIQKKDKLPFFLNKESVFLSGKEKDKKILHSAFIHWKHIIKTMNIQDKYDENYKKSLSIIKKETKNNEIEEMNKIKKIREENTKKIFGIFKIIDGSRKIIIKKESKNILTKISKYLGKKYLDYLLKKIIINKTNANKNIIRSYLFKFLTNTLKINQNICQLKNDETTTKLKNLENQIKILNEEKNNEMQQKIKNIKLNILQIITESIHKKQKKNILKKKFRQYYCNILASNKIKDENLVKKENPETILKNQIKKPIIEKEPLRSQPTDTVIVQLIVEKVVFFDEESKKNKVKKQLADDKLNKVNTVIEKKSELDYELINAEKESEKRKKYLLEIYKGNQVFLKYIFRNTYQYFLEEFKEKIKNESINKCLQKLIKIKKEILRQLLKIYLTKWKIITNYNCKKNENKLFIKLLSLIIEYIIKCKVRKKFIYWYKIANNEKGSQTNIRSHIFKKVKFLLILNEKFKNIYEEKFDKLYNAKNINFCKKTMQKLFLKKIIKSRISLGHFFNIWRINSNNKSNTQLKKITTVNTDLMETNKIQVKKILFFLRKINFRINGSNLIKKIKIIANIDKRKNIIFNLIEKKEKQNKLLFYHYFLRWEIEINQKKSSVVYLSYKNLILSILLSKSSNNNLRHFFLKWRYFKEITDIEKNSLLLSIKILKSVLIKKSSNKLFKSFTKNLYKIHLNIYNENASLLLKKLYKLYALKILQNLFDLLNEILLENSISLKIVFIKILKTKVNQSKNFIYTKKNKTSFYSSLKKKKFRLQLNNSNNLNDQNNIKNNYLSFAINFPKYLNSLIKNRKKEFLNSIKYRYKSITFMKLIHEYIHKKEKANFHYIVDIFKKPVNKINTNKPQKTKLYTLFRKYYIKQLFKNNEEIYRFYKILYIINLTEYLKTKCRLRWIREIMRKWKLICFVKNITNKTMVKMYKNVYADYLEIVNSISGNVKDKNIQNNNNKDEKFNNDAGMLENYNPYNKNSSKFCKLVKKKYIFADLDEHKEKSQKISKNIKEDQKVENNDNKISDNNDNDQKFDAQNKYYKNIIIKRTKK